MKYIKKYEGSYKGNINDFNHKMGIDFQIGTYWRFRNKIQDSIFEVIDRDDKKLEAEVNLLIIEMRGKKNEKIFKLNFSYVDLYSFMTQEYENLIFRKATDEEIDKFEIAKETIKYNL